MFECIVIEREEEGGGEGEDTWRERLRTLKSQKFQMEI